MKMTDAFIADIEREAAGSRRTLERVPDGKEDWKPHEKSMPLGYLATLVATMPSWGVMMVKQDEMDMRPVGGSNYSPPKAGNRQERLAALDKSVAGAKSALSATTDDHLMKTWRFLVGGKVVSELPRHIMLRDAVVNHWVHHRAQLTVYLRLLGVPVPSLYGPSADEGRFD